MIAAAPATALYRALHQDQHGPLLVGFSGGLDSTVLLHALSQDSQVRERGLRAVHVHHGLQPLADEWANHCAEFCDSIGVALTIVHVTVDRDTNEGLEAAARKARYAAFEKTLAAEETLVTAHHRDDQAETFLLRALRGSGPDGLSAMRPWRDFASGRHWRPLLDTPRSLLLAYADQSNLKWLEDPSNEDLHHDRNFLRQRVLPLLRERWMQVDSAFTRCAVLSADAVELLAQEDALALAMARTVDPCALSVSALMQSPAARRARALRRWIDELDFAPLPGEGIERIEDDLLLARADAMPRFQWRGIVIERWRDLLHVRRWRDPLPVDWNIAWDGREPLALPTGDTLALEGSPSFSAPLRVFSRQGGERIALPGRAHSHTLKNVLQELGVPPWEREAMPLLGDEDGKLLAVADLVYSADFQGWLQDSGARLHWHRA